MQTYAENTKRIAVNTLKLYGRMLFSMVVSLYTSRVVLDTLGVEDYGIYGVVGGFVAMFSMISSSLSSAVSRFLTFELGRGDRDRLSKAFSSSLLIHIVLSIVIFIVAETLGVWFINNKMTIPADRMYAANWVFQASILSFMFGLYNVPYIASIISHEKMGFFACTGILDTTLRLIIVLFIAYIPWHFDKLIVYSMLLVVVGICLQIIYISYCRRFEECQFRINFDKEFWKEISSFAGWNFIGCTAGVLKDQGVNVLLNLFVGPILNAARGIAGSVNGAVSGFASKFMTALNPQITKSYAAGDLSYSYYLVERGAKYSFYILLFFAIPIILETEFILAIWLKQYPEHTVNFVRLVLLLSLLDVLSNTLITLQNATGYIRSYQLVVGGTLLMNFPLSYICLKRGMAPESTYVVAIIVGAICMMIRLLFVRKTAGLSMASFIKNVVLNVLAVFAAAVVIPLFCHLLLPYGWERFLAVGFVSVVASSFAILYVGCNKEERLFIIGKLVQIKRMIKK